MTNTLASLGMRWQPSAAEPAYAARWSAAAAAPADIAAASARKWAALMPLTHGAQLPTVDVVRLRGYSFAIPPRGTSPV